MAAEDTLVAPDYLGSPAPVSVRGTPSLPADGPLAPSAGPATTGGGGGVATGSGAAAPGAAGTVTTSGASGPAEPGAAAPGLVLPEATKAAILALPVEQRASLVQQLQGLGGKFASMLPEINKLFAGGPPDFKFGDLNKMSEEFGGFEATGGAGVGSASPPDALGKSLPGLPEGTSTAATFATEHPEIFSPEAGIAPEISKIATALQSGDPTEISKWTQGILEMTDSPGVFLNTQTGAITTGDQFLDSLGGASSAPRSGDLLVSTGGAGADAAAGASGTAASALGGIASAAGFAKSAWDELQLLNSRASTDQKVFDTLGKAGQVVSTIYGGPVGGIAAGLVHQYISTPIVEAIFGKFGPSTEWKNFPINVSNTLRGTETANQQLATDLVNANTPEEQTAALQKFKAAVEGAGVGGFSGRSGDIPDEPGAGGSRHEGGISADFTGEEVGLRAELDAARAGASPEARLAALRDAMGGFFTKKDMATPGPIREGTLTPGQAANLSTVTGTTIPSGDPTAAAAAIASAIEQAKTASAATNESGYVTPPADLLAAYQQLTGTPYTPPGAEAPPPAGTPEAFEWSSRQNLAGNTGGN